MGVDRVEPVGAQALPLFAGEQAARLAADQLPHEAPVDEADSQFQRARPVGPDERWTLVEPAAQLRVQRMQPGDVVRHRPRLRQAHEVQVAVQFPQVLDVADLFAVLDGDVARVDGRRDDARVRIAVPHGRYADVEPAVGEEYDVAGADAVGIGQQRLAFARRQRGRTVNGERSPRA